MNSITNTNANRNLIQGTWTEWQDRDGIYLTLPGSNSVYAGFESQEEAEVLAAVLEGDWKVVRWGVFKTMSDKDAVEATRSDRIRYGFRVEPRVY